MMRMKTKSMGLSTAAVTGGGGESGGGNEWEVRPGGMLVQKRNPDSDRNSVAPLMIRVRVKYGSIYHEISISSQATFGELKKMLSGPTGLPHQDQKLLYKNKERDSKAFLDTSGVKDKSKMVLTEDPISKEKRLLEMRNNAKTEKASKAISEISLEVDRLAGRVSALETVINKGGKVAEKDMMNLIELLMNELLKLDGIMADGDVKLQRKLQVTRVQKYVETLDMLKIKNSMPNTNGDQIKTTNKHHKQPNGQRLEPIQEQPPRCSNGDIESLQKPPKYSNGQRQTQIQEPKPVQSLIDMPIDYNHRQEIQEQHEVYQKPRNSGSGSVVVTTQWETFDSAPPHSTAASASAVANNPVTPRFNWEFFD